MSTSKHVTVELIIPRRIRNTRFAINRMGGIRTWIIFDTTTLYSGIEPSWTDFDLCMEKYREAWFPNEAYVEFDLSHDIMAYFGVIADLNVPWSLKTIRGPRDTSHLWFSFADAAEAVTFKLRISG